MSKSERRLPQVRACSYHLQSKILRSDAVGVRHFDEAETAFQGVILCVSVMSYEYSFFPSQLNPFPRLISCRQYVVFPLRVTPEDNHYCHHQH